MAIRGRISTYAIYVGLLSFSSALFTWMVFAVSGIYGVTEAGLNPLQLVLVGTALELSAFLFEVPTGVVADVYSRRLSVIIGLVLRGLGFVLWGAFPHFATILVAQVLWGVGYTFGSGAQEAWLADEIGEERAGPAFLRAAQATQAGSLLGIPLGIALGLIGLSVPMVLGGVLIIVLAGVLILIMPETGFHPTAQEDRTSWDKMTATLRQGLGEVRRRPVLGQILLITVVFGAASESFDRLREIHFLHNFTFPAFGGWQPVVWFGIIFEVALVLSILATEVVRRRVDTGSHHGVARSLTLINVLLVVAMLAFGLAQGFGVALAAIWAGGILRQVSLPLTTAWFNQGLEPSVRATVFSLRGQADALGQTGGGPIFGAIANGLSIRAGLIAGTAVLALTLPLYARILRVRPADQTE